MNIVKMMLAGILIYWVVLTGFYLIRVGLFNRSSNDGEAYLNHIAQIRELSLENQLLENQIASYSALQYIEVKAKQMGFKEYKRPEYLHE